MRFVLLRSQLLSLNETILIVGAEVDKLKEQCLLRAVARGSAAIRALILLCIRLAEVMRESFALGAPALVAIAGFDVVGLFD